MFTKLIRSIVAGALLCSTAPSFAFDNQDIWWNAGQSGMGFFIGHQGSRLGIGWFHYGSDGKASYLLLSGDLVNGTVQGNLERSTGPQPGSGYDAGQVVREIVGTASLTFHSQNSATFSYNYDGRSGSMDISRMTFSTNGYAAGTWRAANSGVSSGCTVAEDNGEWEDAATLTIGALSGNQQTITMTRPGTDGDCTMTLTPTRTGSLITANGSIACPELPTPGTITTTTRPIGDNYMLMEYTVQEPSPSLCTHRGVMGLTKQ